MMNQRPAKQARPLPENELSRITLDSRIAAIRWDVCPWSLVLDIDVPSSEDRGAPMHRAWLVFHDVSEISFPIFNARLPTGIWMTSEMGVSELPKKAGFQQVQFVALFPEGMADGATKENPAKDVVIVAKHVSGVISCDACAPGETGLTWESRSRLADDTELLGSLRLPGENGWASQGSDS